jgi:hypothetical protein
MRKAQNGESDANPYDSYPPEAWDKGSACDFDAWRQVLPNFPFGGQMWSKARFQICWWQGRPWVCPMGKPEEFFQGEFPPESETADVVEWTPELLAEYHRLCRQGRKRGMDVEVLHARPDGVFLKW